jgi:predicted dehydrogenase
MTKPLRIGFIGAGIMAQFQIYPSLYFAPIELAAVCDLDPDLAQGVAKKYGARAYGDYREMFAQEDLEAVIVQMHPRPRQQTVLDCLAAGYHVFMPKPPAETYAATVELAEGAAAAGRILMVNFQSRFSFGVARAREIMAQPDFGKLSHASFSFCSGGYVGDRRRDYNGPVHAFMLDFTPHHLDLARYLGGEVRKLSLYHNESEGRAAVALALEFENGAIGTMQMSSQRIWWRNYDRIELTGQGEYLVIDSLWKVQHYTEAQNTFTENYRDQRSIELTGDAYALEEFVAAVRGDRQARSDIVESVKTMRLWQTIWDAMQVGQQGELDL